MSNLEELIYVPLSLYLFLYILQFIILTIAEY